jgi:adenylate kinase family enzyme
MKVFIIGLPGAGKTTAAKNMCEKLGSIYLDPDACIRHTFREPNENESIQQYMDLYNEYINQRLVIDPDLIIKSITDIIKVHPIIYGSENDQFIIDGISNPRDFIQLFDYTKDLVVFLNRMDNEMEYRGVQNISLSVMKDYCLWLASSNLLSKDRWFEFNFTIPGDEKQDLVKKAGFHNTVILARSFKRVISSLEEILHKYQA